MKRFLVFAILGPPLAAVTLFLIVLPVAASLIHGRVDIVIPSWSAVYLGSLFPALVLAFFDWLESVIELPRRPIGTGIAGWVLAAISLQYFLALPDLPAWWIGVVGLLGAIPGFICSLVTLKLQNRRRVAA